MNDNDDDDQQNSSPSKNNTINNNNKNKNKYHYSQFRSTLLPEHGQRLVQDGIVSRVPEDQRDSSKAFCIPFFIIEEKDGQPRLRFICWTEFINTILKDDYTPQMSQLQHSSRFIDAVRDECGVIGDLKISFFQVEIPQQFRPYFRFPDSNGNLYEMNRLPMGLRTSAEIMQMIVETIAGVPAAVKPTAEIDGELVQLSNLKLKTCVWIDGFQSTGLTAECDEAAARIKKVAKWCNVTWKDEVEVTTKYDFIGINFDHKLHRVAVATKTLAKLQREYNTKSSYHITQLEKDVSRLFFCSGVLRIIPAHFYFTIKWINRQISMLNKTGKDSAIALTPVVAASLNRWLAQAKGFRELRPSSSSE